MPRYLCFASFVQAAARTDVRWGRGRKVGGRRLWEYKRRSGMNLQVQKWDSRSRMGSVLSLIED